MSYATVWASKIAERLEQDDYAAAHEVSTDDTGCSTTLEYALAGAVDRLLAENKKLKATLFQISSVTVADRSIAGMMRDHAKATLKEAEHGQDES